MLINSLGLKNFKCFEELDVKFAPITLLTGANSSGKSSLINAILAVLQTEQFPFYLSPNGKYVNMGGFEEIAFTRNNKAIIQISLQIIEPYSRQETIDPKIIDIKTTWQINRHNGLPQLQNMTALSEEWKVEITKTKKYKLNSTIKWYYSAFYDHKYLKNIVENQRGTYFETQTDETISFNNIIFNSVKQMKDFFDAGIDYRLKEFFLSLNYFDTYFNYLGSFRLPPERTYNQKAKADNKVATSGEGYIDQLIEWEETDTEKFLSLNNFIRDLELMNEIKANRLKGGRFELNVKAKKSSKLSSLTDVGFGISQFLPIIVADLQLYNKSCLAISQPEIHLHPKVQAQFGNYLANQIKQTQKQYIVETHSEYLLNRIRLLLVTGELKPEDVRVLYFENDGVKSTVHDVEFATDGQIKGAPQGFFDTYGIDVMNIAMNAVQ